MVKELSQNHPIRPLIDYGNFVVRARLLEEGLREAGYGILKPPKYPFPIITLASPRAFDGQSLLQEILEDARNGKLDPQPPSFIDIGFKRPFSHPDGSFRSGYRTYEEEDPLQMLDEQLGQDNSLQCLSLAWGERPYDPAGEICDAAVSLEDLSYSVATGIEETVHSENNARALALEIEFAGIGGWHRWATIYPKSESPLFAKLAIDIAEKARKIGQKVAALVCVEDFFEDTYDTEQGAVVSSDDLIRMGEGGLINLSQEICEKLRNRRSNLYE